MILGCLLLCVKITKPIVNYGTIFHLFENNAILECSLHGAAPLQKVSWSVLSKTLQIFWQERLRRTLQKMPECLIV